LAKFKFWNEIKRIELKLAAKTVSKTFILK
jgi:hypothetical protein